MITCIMGRTREMLTVEKIKIDYEVWKCDFRVSLRIGWVKFLKAINLKSYFCLVVSGASNVRFWDIRHFHKAIHTVIVIFSFAFTKIYSYNRLHVLN